MALTDLEDWIMRELDAKRGVIEGLPVRSGATVEAMEQAIDCLRKRRYVEIIGPPNQNSDLGKDVDQLRLLQYGAAYLRAAGL